MFEITAENAELYLRSNHWIGPGPVHTEPLGGGVSNLVLRVQTAADRFVLKQSRPQLRTRDPWFSDVSRIHREQEVMEALGDILPSLTVPRVLFVDRENFAFAMSDASPATVWKESLLAGNFDFRMGARAGEVLGKMHELSAGLPRLWEAFRDRIAFVQLRIEPFYVRVQERRPEVTAAVQPLIDSMMTRSEALCHGDYTPKNMLVHDEGFTLVDYETAHFGDPTMDLGLFLTHLTLKAFRRPEWRDESFELIDSFWRNYAQEITFRPVVELETRGVGHWGACLLARIDGTSPVDYLPEEPKRELVRRLARSILLDGMNTIADVLAWCDRELAAMAAKAIP
jgi:5-methylthioribose kinase